MNKGVTVYKGKEKKKLGIPEKTKTKSQNKSVGKPEKKEVEAE